MWIADEPVIFVKGDGTQIVGRIAIGTPSRASGGEMRCPVAIDGLWPSLPAIAGDSSLQALLLGIRFVGKMLTEFCDRGGKLFHPEALSDDGSIDSDYEIDMGALFGPLIR